MLGRHHLLLSLGVGASLLVPWFSEYSLLVCVMIVGVAIGSLIPDVDAEDAAIFHGDLRGLSGDIGRTINDLIAPIFPVFGYATEYLIYKPMVRIYGRTLLRGYDLKEKHRGLLHSWIGIVSATAMTGLYMTPLLIYLELFDSLFLAGFLGAYILGAFLHLLEDSCTKTGVTFNHPFSRKRLHGQLTTTARPEDTKWPRRFIVFHGALAGSLFLVAESEQYAYTTPEVTAAAAGILLISWIVFIKGIARARYD